MLVAGNRPFKEYFTQKIYPAIQGDIERLLKTLPKRIAEKHNKQVEKEKEKKKHEDNEEGGRTPQPLRAVVTGGKTASAGKIPA